MGKVQFVESYITCEVKALMNETTDKTGVFEAYAAGYGNLDLVDDIIEKGAFAKTIQEAGKRLPLLWMHEKYVNENLIGYVTDFREDDIGLFHKGYIDFIYRDGTPNKTAMNTFDKIESGAAGSESIGFRTIKANYEEVPGEGPNSSKIIRHITEAKLLEVSLLLKGFGANPVAGVTNIKGSDDILNYIMENKQDKEFCYKILSLLGVKPEQIDTFLKPSVKSTPIPIMKGMNYDNVLRKIKEIRIGG
jgi:HK97 family phage prohead protease